MYMIIYELYNIIYIEREREMYNMLKLERCLKNGLLFIGFATFRWLKMWSERYLRLRPAKIESHCPRPKPGPGNRTAPRFRSCRSCWMRLGPWVKPLANQNDHLFSWTHEYTYIYYIYILYYIIYIYYIYIYICIYIYILYIYVLHIPIYIYYYYILYYMCVIYDIWLISMVYPIWTMMMSIITFCNYLREPKKYRWHADFVSHLSATQCVMAQGWTCKSAITQAKGKPLGGPGFDFRTSAVLRHQRLALTKVTKACDQRLAFGSSFPAVSPYPPALMSSIYQNLPVNTLW